MTEEIEVDAEQGKNLVGGGSEVYVFINNYSELELVKEVLGAGDKVHEMYFDEARAIITGRSTKSEADKYANAVIVCPHGRTSLSFAKALSQMGIHAYSLKGGIEGLKSRT